MNEVMLHPTACAICESAKGQTEIFPANFDFAAFNEKVFSARRIPDRVHYRIVKCTACGLVRSDPVADDDVLSRLYADSTLDYGEEIGNLRKTYHHHLGKAEKWVTSKSSFMEVGCGNGFVLEEAKKLGYERVIGIEPSTDALSKADPSIRGSIINDVLRPGCVPKKSVDIACFFQVFDHLTDPLGVLNEVHRVLSHRGIAFFLHHNVEALSARVMREKSPIYDIEHAYLYSPRTMRRLLESNGFTVLHARPIWNRISLSYLVQLLPIPAAMKERVLPWVRRSVIGRLPIWLPLGNMCVIAQRVGD